MTTLNQQSIRWPAEWEPQDAVWLSWPHNQDTWPGQYEPVPKAFTAFANQVSQSTPVRVLASKQHAPAANKHLASIKNLELVDIETNDCWIRDYGPTFTIGSEGRTVGIDWHYNSWGGKYPPWDSDSEAARKILQHLDVDRYESSLCLEGGAIETDGAGRLLLTPDCVLTDTRNRGVSKVQVEAELSRALGVREFIWLTGGGLIGDDTDGHIDQIARFIDPHNMVVASCDRDDENYRALEENRKQLIDWNARTRASINIHTLQIPAERYVNGQRVPESYCNFLITGPQVIVPTFADDRADAQAIAKLRQWMPSHEVIGLDASNLSWGLGAFHCMSQQQPSRSKA